MLARGLAEFAVSLNPDAIPPEVIERTKACVLDCLGAALAGSSTALAQGLLQMIEQEGGHQEATLIGRGGRATMRQAALYNGVIAHALDYDDVSWSMNGHPSVTLLPPVLAIGEGFARTGRELLTAFVVGLELEGKLGAAVNPELYRRGWHATAVLGTLGAALASARLLGLDVGATIQALGIAASLAAGLRENFGTMTKPLHAGRAGENGVAAALLARAGLTASEQALDGPFGFCRVFSEGVDAEKVLAALGRPFELVHPGVVFKRFPSCAGTHPALDAVLALAAEFDLRVADVELVECATDPQTRDMLIYPEPRTGLEGKFSMPFCVAVALRDRRVGLADFTEDKVRDPELIALMQRVRLTVDPELERSGYLSRSATTVTIRLRDGPALARRVDLARGNPENPLSREELVEKFRDCAGTVLPPPRVQACLEQVLALDRLPDLTSLAALLAPGQES